MSGVYGADVSSPVSAGQWSALKSQKAVSFAVVRCYEGAGHVDPNAPGTVKAAWAAGLASVDVYHFPCLRVDAADQVRDAVSAISAAGARFERYWIDVEQGAGWSASDFAGNAAFLRRMLQAAEALGLQVGIYTSPYEWSITVNSAGFSSYPLWYAQYDGVASFADFVPFGGWTQPVMKQFAGDQVSGGVCFDGNWAPVAGTAPSSGSGAPPSSGSGASAPPSSGSTAGVRGAVAAYAASIAGTSACSKRLEYMSIIAPGETPSTQGEMCTMSSCGLTVAGIWRACGYRGPALNAPYQIGSALSRLIDIGQDTGAYIPYSAGVSPKPGDMVLLGGEAHVYTVVSVSSEADGTTLIHSVDGGYPSGGTGPGSDCNAIAATQHRWRDGQDTDPYLTRPILAVIDVTQVITPFRMPLAGFVQAAPPGSRGVDSDAAITASTAASLAASGHAFCVRHVSPNEAAVAALTAAEAAGILGAGLGLMLTQRIGASALALSSSLGTEHGSAAAAGAVAIGFPMCVNLWLLLDGIPPSTDSADLVGYYNAWYAAVYQAGFLPGLRVGPSEVLDGQALGELAFCHYWQSSGVSVTPSPRGYQLTDGGAATVAGVALRAVTAQNDAGGGSQGPGQAEWLIATPR